MYEPYDDANFSKIANDTFEHLADFDCVSSDDNLVKCEYGWN